MTVHMLSRRSTPAVCHGCERDAYWTEHCHAPYQQCIDYHYIDQVLDDYFTLTHATCILLIRDTNNG
jgi:hypothetical protein